MGNANQAGTVLTCSMEGCDCELRIERPCPHGDTYTCACGQPMTAKQAAGMIDLEHPSETIEEMNEKGDVPGGIRP